MTHQPTVKRIRYIPAEEVDISSDTVLYRDEEILVTSWLPIKPRKDFQRGVSCAYLKDGCKVSRFMKESGEAVYWYCDIIDVDYHAPSDTYRFTDLLADVRIWPDGRVELIDLDELADAQEQGLITPQQAIRCLRILDGLLKRIYSGELPAATEATIRSHGGIMG